MKKATVLKPFLDLKEGVSREIGDTFPVRMKEASISEICYWSLLKRHRYRRKRDL